MNKPWPGYPAPPRSDKHQDVYLSYLEARFFEVINDQLPEWLKPELADRSIEHRKSLAKRWSVEFDEFYGKKGYMVGKTRMVQVNKAISGWVRRNIDDAKHLKRINAPAKAPINAYDVARALGYTPRS